MTGKHIVSLVAICACGAAVIGCGSRTPENIANESSHKAMLSGSVSEPESADEAEILRLIPAVKDGESRTAGKVSVEVKKTYHAASGRRCKAVTLIDASSSANKHVTICEVDGEWAYMPNVAPGASRPKPDR